MARKKLLPKKKQNVIYSRLSYEGAYTTKKNILEIQESLLNIIQNIRAYKEMRKKEFVWKIKLKRNYNSVKESTNKILKEFPETDNIKEIKKEHKERKNKMITSPTGLSVESELAEIQKKLEEMNKSRVL